MNDNHILSFCRKNGIRLPPSWRHSCQAVRFHNSNETLKHFKYKSEVAFELMKQGQTVFTELQFDFSERFGKKKRMRFPVCDLLWLDEKIVVEFESRISHQSIVLKSQQFEGFNTFVFDIEKFSVHEILEKIGVVKNSRLSPNEHRNCIECHERFDCRSDSPYCGVECQAKAAEKAEELFKKKALEAVSSKDLSENIFFKFAEKEKELMCVAGA